MSDLLFEKFSRDLSPAARRGQKVLLVEDSRMFGSMLSQRFRVELNLDVTLCTSMKTLETTIHASDHGFSLAVVNLNLPDAAYGEALDMLLDHRVPSIVFTAAADIDMRDRLMERSIIDYVLKDNTQAADNLVASVRRSITNSKTTVLVVDAMPVARKMLVDSLEMQRFEVYEAASGSAAIQALDQYAEIELVLIDDALPDGTGWELTRQITHRRNSDRLRVIGLSASDDRLAATAYLKAGATDFLRRPFVAEELKYRIGRVIDTLSQLRQLRAAASVDYLTGLYNRRYFFDQGPRIANDCLRLETRPSIGILDIDHFKRLNDTYGHEIGDQVLKAVATRLQTFLEGSRNLLSRIGGEEFAILFADMDSSVATEFCEELRENISGLKIQADGEELSVTVSIGIASINAQETFENYLNAADQFLYMAKHRGRNRVFSDTRMAAEEGR
ncbi:GGDEF domain-containing protein [Rhizobium tumorigenes]|uniref:diguanylate cyclase n=1 Tax=Rhizobium tumorigenes TaxID=2041385 RepID=A0AAF1KTG1_9HYPH|nr:diguanylate cyclase [Rhizobium tumorigenes]WFR97165.1 diguanylate cyclase [Rhizobium tumorigenes]